MPELPEAEVVRRGLAERITGRRIERVAALHPRPVRYHPNGQRGFEDGLTGRTFAEPKRRGKYIWLPFCDDDALVVHLGMSGQFRIDAPGAPLLANTRVLFDLDDGTQLRFVDQRMFGGLQLSAGGARLPSQIRHIAPDPFETQFDLNQVAAKIMAKRSTIKRVLLDQTTVSGIGNIYADESLWRARTHYNHPTAELSTRRTRAILRAVQDVMAEALEQGGTSFDALYVNVNGESGYFARSLNAYGQEGKPCARCGTIMVRESFMNRSSTLCPRCQRLG